MRGTAQGKQVDEKLEIETVSQFVQRDVMGTALVVDDAQIDIVAAAVKVDAVDLARQKDTLSVLQPDLIRGRVTRRLAADCRKFTTRLAHRPLAASGADRHDGDTAAVAATFTTIHPEVSAAADRYIAKLQKQK